MIILDANVISELFRPAPERAVLRWLKAQGPVDLFTTAVSEAEIFRGIEFMPAGRRRSELLTATEAYFQSDLEGRVLSFDSAAARHYAEIAGLRKRTGLPLKEFDVQIAAICRSLNARLATRNLKDFAGSGLELINPWQVR